MSRVGCGNVHSFIKTKKKESNINLGKAATAATQWKQTPAILETGVNGIALSGTILRAEDPAAETRKILNMKRIIK